MRIVLQLARVNVAVTLLHEEYSRLYHPYLTQNPAELSVEIHSQDIDKVISYYPPNVTPAYIEHMELCKKVSDVLIPCNRVVFHGTAFLWHEKAWIFTAPAGTGKSTQYLLWKLLFGDDIQIINGDKPILHFQNDGEIVVFPSPWNGKENMGRLINAPLGGIVLLEQGNENRIDIVKHGVAQDIYSQFLFTAADTSAISAVCRMADTMLRNIPVWHFVNCGDRSSAILCHDFLEEAVQ